jgi:hypothetical protein
MIKKVLKSIFGTLTRTSLVETDVRAAENGEEVVRFLFQSNNFNTTIVRKNGLNVQRNGASGRLELSMYLLSSMPDNSATSSGDFWTCMNELGQRSEQEAKGCGIISAEKVRSLTFEKAHESLDVEVNNLPRNGHCDIINWSEDKEDRIVQVITLGKSMQVLPRPKPNVSA